MKINFSKRDRICFLGDSITAHGFWIAEVAEYFLQNYPELEIGFFNCGISGTSGREAELKNRLYVDFFNYFPKYAVIMFGMNDMARWLYDPETETPERIERREARIVEYRATLEHLISLCRERDITPIICTPTPYNDYGEYASVSWGYDRALEKCAVTAKAVAEENGLILVDMRSVLMEHIEEKPLRDDRSHPNGYGHHLMAEKFLFDIGAKDKIESEKECAISYKNSQRFEIEDILRDIMFVEFNYMGWQYAKSYALPYRKALLNKRIETEKRDFSEVYKNYMAYADVKDELQGELLKRTLEMYE